MFYIILVIIMALINFVGWGLAGHLAHFGGGCFLSGLAVAMILDEIIG